MNNFTFFTNACLPFSGQPAPYQHNQRRRLPMSLVIFVERLTNLVLLVTLCALSLGMHNAYAAANNTDYPSEFADFFAETEQRTFIKINGISAGVEVNAIVNFDNFRLADNASSLAPLRNFLQEVNLAPALIDLITTDAVAGITTDAECSQNLATCKLLPQLGNARYIYNFDDNVLILFIGADGFVEQEFDAQYQSPYSVANAIINNSDLYGSFGGNGEQSYTWSNLTTVGLPVGHLTLDSQYRNGNNLDGDFELYTGLYNAEINDMRLQAGRSNYTLSFNTTDYLNNGMNTAGDLIALGRSQNLLIGEASNQQRYDFYAPQSAVLEVYRGDDLILTRVVNEGKHAITYTDLPTGVYSATMVLNVGGEAILTNTFQVVNNNSYVLAVGQVDYMLSMGEFREKNSLVIGYNDYARQYARGLLNYRLLDSLFIGGGFTRDENDHYAQLGSHFYWGDTFAANYSVGHFSSDEWYQTAHIDLAPVYIDYRQFDANLDDHNYRLSHELYGRSRYRDIAIGVSGEMAGINSYMRLSHARYQGYSDLENNIISEKNQRTMFTFGANRQVLTGTLSLNVDYTHEQSRPDDDYNITLSWTKRLGSNVSVQANVYGNQDGFSRNTNYLRYAHNGDNYNANVSASASVNDNNETYNDLSGTFSGYNSYVLGSAYAYADSRGNQSTTLSASSSQVISRDGISFTSEKSRAYAKIKLKGLADVDLAGPVQLSMKTDSQYSHRVDTEQSETVVKLQEYTDLTLGVDKATNNIEVTNTRLKQFIYPGTYHTLASDVVKLLSMTVVFDDVFNKPISDLNCIGDGCVNVEPLSSDGVYRVNYRQGQEIRLVSSKGLCLYDDKENKKATKNTIHYGFCLPSVDNDTLKWQNTDALLAPGNISQNRVVDKNILLYLGEYQSGSESSRVATRLESVKLHFKRFEIGQSHYFYILDTTQFNSQQRNVLQELNAYVFSKEFKQEYKFSLNP